MPEKGDFLLPHRILGFRKSLPQKPVCVMSEVAAGDFPVAPSMTLV
jgi:hypothetical protein